MPALGKSAGRLMFPLVCPLARPLAVFLAALLVVPVLLAGCGLKTGLVVYDDAAPLPEISQLSYQQGEKKMIFTLDIQGGSHAVVYHIDRAIIAPDCKCIGNWLRYYESSPSEQRLALTRHIKLRPDQSYAFRLRVKDSLGRLSAWSQVIKTKLNRAETEAIHE